MMSKPMLEVRIVQGLTTEQRDILLGWSDDVFGTKHLEWHGRKKDWSVLGFVDGHLVCHVGVLKDEVHVAGEPVWVGGIGAVITIPSAQHNGYAHALLQHSVAFIRDELDMQFGLLFCLPRLISFYEGAGWHTVTAAVTIEQPQGRVASPVTLMYYTCHTRTQWPAGVVEIGWPW